MSETSDMLALANNIRDNDGLNGNGSLVWILILFFLIGGNGYGNRCGDYATKTDLYEGLNSQNTFSEFRSLQNETTRGFSDLNQHLCNGFAGINQNISNNFANTNMGIAKGLYDETLAMNCGFNGVQAALAENRYAMQDCCCQIKNRISEDGEKTRALIQDNETQRLRDALQDEKNERLATGLVTQNIIQTNSLEAYFRQLFNGGCGCNC